MFWIIPNLGSTVLQANYQLFKNILYILAKAIVAKVLQLDLSVLSCDTFDLL